MCEEAQYEHAYYIVFNRYSTESKMTEDFKQQFQSKSPSNQLETLTRQECLEYFQVEDKSDDIVVIEDILNSDNLVADSVIYFDETSIERPSKSYDWSKLKNPRKDVTVIVSFQPLQESTKFNTICPALPE